MRSMEYKIKDICQIKSGKRLPVGENFAIAKTDYKYIRARDIKNGKIDTSDLAYISYETHQKIRKYIINEGDIALTIAGTVGEIGFAGESVDGVNLTENAVRLTEFKKDIINGKYLMYLLSQKPYKSYMQVISGGVAQPKLGIYKIEKMKVTVPPIRQQDKIASILSTYDDLIEKNNRKIAILQEMAEEIYKEWFVRFRFPGYKTARFKDGIPEGWKYRPFGEIVTCERGISYSSEEIDCEDGVKLINLKNINAYGGFRLDGTKKYNGKYKNNQVVQCGDLVMGVTDMTQDRRTVGAVALIPPFDNTCVISADLIKLVSHIDNIFIYCLCKYGYYSKFFSQFANGSNVLHLKPSSLRNQKVLIPTEELINKFVEIVKPINDTINNLNMQNDTLTQQRDLLLPRLMSGKLEVKA